MNERRIERVLIAARGGEGMALLRAVEASGREGVLLMREEDGRQAWIDEVAFVVHVPAAEDGHWPDWGAVASAALDAGCDALLAAGELAGHAGLSERLVSINVYELGPGHALLQQVADGVRLLDLARSLGIRVVPALDLPEDRERALSEAEGWLHRWGPPVWLRVRSPDGGISARRFGTMEAALEGVGASLTLGRLSLLHTPPNARVIEVPVMGDGAGGVLALGDREVTLARAGEPVLVETPAADLSAPLRAELQEQALKLCRALRWRAAGAVVFAVTADGRAFLRELRPGVSPWQEGTRAVYGLDLVELMLALAEGQQITFAQEEIVPGGAALTLRLFVEAAAPLPEHLAPQEGPRPEEEEGLAEDTDGLPLGWVKLPEDVALDIPLVAGDHVRLGEDLGVVTVTAPTRQSCLVRGKSALDHIDIGGVQHTGTLLTEVLSDSAYWRGPAGLDP